MTFDNTNYAGPSVRLTASHIKRLRKVKEKIYFVLSSIIGALIWCGLSYYLVSTKGWEPFAFGVAFYGLGTLFAIWVISSIVKAYFFGHSVLVSGDQFPIVQKLVLECAHALGIKKAPSVFIIHGRGILNAFAMKIFRARYVVLNAEVIDFALKRGKQEELRFIIAHEFAHHVLGHLSARANFFTYPAGMTLFLPLALSRAREYSCDSIAAAVLANSRTSASALLMLAHGSQSLANDVNVEAFVKQEKMVPKFGGFIREIFQTHPRLTRRVQNVLKG